MRDFMKLTTLAGAVAFVVWGVPACGSDDDGDDGKTKTGGTGGGVIGGAGGTDAATGGTGGGTGGSTGGTGGGTGGSGGSTSITCGSLTCPGYNIAGFLDIPACCSGSASDKCGADVPELVAGFIGVPAGCYETEQAGPEDTGCPPLSVDLPIGDGGSVDFPGCCNTASSTCGVVLDTSQFGGPNFGCANLPTEGGTPQACPTTDGGTGGSAGGSGDAATDAPADAPASG